MPFSVIQESDTTGNSYNTSTCTLPGSSSLTGTTTSGNGCFAADTTAGNLLLCLISTVATCDESGGYSGAPTPLIAIPSTAGVDWVLVNGCNAPSSTEPGTGPSPYFGYASSALAVYMAPNAAVLSSATPTYVNATSSSETEEFFIEYALIEIAGAANPSSPLDFTTGPISGGVGALPSLGSLTVSAATSDIVMLFLCAPDGDDPPSTSPAAFAGGDFAFGWVADILNAGAGSYSTAFTGTGMDENWALMAIAFGPSGSAGPPPPSTPILEVSPTSLSFSATQGGSNPASQNVSVSNGDGGTLSWTDSISSASWLSASPSSGTNSGTVAASVDISGLNVGTYTGYLTFSASGADDSPQTVTVTLTISGTGGSASSTGFTPEWPPIKKQPIGLWGLEAKRADSITVDGLKQSMLDHIDTVTTLTFPFVPVTDLPAWRDFELYALSGAFFVYAPIPDYPSYPGPTYPYTYMFQYPATAMWELNFEATDVPWVTNAGMNSAYPFSTIIGVGTLPSGLPVTAGAACSMTYVSGTVQRSTSYGAFGPTGDPSNPGPTSSQSSGWPGYWCAPSTANAGCCIGAWADEYGNLVAAPFAIGDTWTGTAPAGAQQLMIGVNDYEDFDDNVGSWQFNITGFNMAVAELLSMDWTPRFESFGNFSLSMKLLLVEDLTSGSGVMPTFGDILLESGGGDIELESGTGGIQLE
jgi:Viral BACON domain